MRGFTGTVTVRQGERAVEEGARVDHPLHAGDVVTTAADSTAEVEFAGGNRVALQSVTSLVIREGGGTTAQVGAVLLAGAATVSSGGRGVVLAIGTPFGLTEIGAVESSAEVSADKGCRVLVGEVVVVDASGGRTTVAAGSVFTIDGLVLAVERDKQQTFDLTIAPLEFVLLASPKQVQVMKAGETTWRAPRTGEVLETGDAVRTRKAHGTLVQVSDKSSLTLTPRTEVLFQGGPAKEEQRRARYELKIGNILVHLERDPASASVHEITVGGLAVSVAPGAKEASVEVNAGEKGRARVTVRLGRVRLSDGTEVEAGSTATIQDGKVVGAPHPLADTKVEVKARSSVVVSYAGGVPAIELAWPREEGADRYEVEVGTDKELLRPLLREEISSNHFVYDRFHPGRYYWRVKGKGDWARGVFVIEKSRESVCANCRRRNTIDDTGEATVVYYQRRLPAITLRWAKVAGAANTG